MSWRGSFVTEYIYCKKCLEAAKEILIDTEKYHFGVHLPSWSKHETNIPIIAGKLGGIYPHQQIEIMDELVAELQPKLCHNLTIVAIPEGEEPKVYRIKHVEDPPTKKLVLKKELEASETTHPHYIADCKKIVAHCKSKGYLIEELTAYNAWTAFSDGYARRWLDVEKAIAKADLMEILKCCCDVEIIQETKKE